MSVYIDGFELDVARAIEHKLPAQVTEQPLESGANFADHKLKHSRMLTIEGVVSDTPIGGLAKRRQQFTLVDGEAFATPSQEARARMEALLESPEPITVETPTRTYRNMVMEDLSEPEDKQTGKAYVFTAVFKQLKIVSNLRTTVRVAADRNGKKLHRGNKASVEVTTAVGDPDFPTYLLNT